MGYEGIGIISCAVDLVTFTSVTMKVGPNFHSLCVIKSISKMLLSCKVNKSANCVVHVGQDANNSTCRRWMLSYGVPLVVNHMKMSPRIGSFSLCG